MSNLYATRIVILFLMCATRSSLVAQSVQSQSVVPYKMIRTESGLWPKIELNIGIADSKFGQSAGLTANEVVVSEDGVEQTNIEVEKSAQPLSICFVIDKSSSMKENQKSMTALAKQLFPVSTTAEAAIIAFDARVYLKQAFTTDAAKWDATLKSIDFGGGSSLYDAVWVAMDQVSARSAERKKIVVVLSDGDDNFSRVPVEDLEKKARLPGAPIVYWVGFPSTKATLRPMNDIATATGGVSSISPHISLMTESGEAIEGLLRGSYFDLRYTSTHAQTDGKLHKVVVKSRPGAGASSSHIVFRREYYAPTK